MAGTSLYLLKDKKQMHTLKRLPFSAILVAGSILCLCANQAHAQFSFQPIEPTLNGVTLFDPTQTAQQDLTNNPARAIVGSSKASLHNFGSYFVYDVEIVATGVAQTAATTGGIGSSAPPPTEIPFRIVGTQGQPDGTPVTILLHSFSNAYTIVTVGDNGYDANALSTIEGFSVGDEFDFGSTLFANAGQNATHTVNVSFQGVGTAAAPEPGTVALLGTGVIALSSLLRRPKRSK